jgi:type I restriction enzyme S subunit
MIDIKNTKEKSIPEGWVKIPLSKCADFISEKISTEKINSQNYISTENLLPNKLGVVDAATIPNISKVNYFKNGDTLFSNIRTYFKKVWFASFEGGASNDVLIFRSKENTDEKFLYYLISSNLFINFTVLTAKGTKMPRGDKGAMTTFQINLPPIIEQHAIADALSSFDDKIELLREQNKTLEQTAQIIFKEWFGKYSVDKPEALPEGWSFGSLSQFADHVKDTINPFDNPEASFSHYSLPAYDDSLNPVIESGLEIKSNKYKVQDSVFLVSKLNPFTPRIWTIFNAPINAICSTEFQVVKPKDKKLFSFIHCLLNSRYFTDDLSQKVKGTSSSHQRVNPQDIFDVACVIPSDNSLILFNKDIDDLIKKKDINHEQIQTLSMIRDSLLPKLMSGEMRGKEFIK